MASGRVIFGVLMATIVAVGVACTHRQGDPPELAITSTSAPVTTVLDAATDSGPTSTVPGRSPQEIKSSLDAAIAVRDFCQFVAALDEAVPDVTQGEQVVTVYEDLAIATEAATSFVPVDLADPWKQVVITTGEGAKAALRVGGDLSDPVLRSPFTSGSFDSAMSSVENWSDRNCR